MKASNKPRIVLINYYRGFAALSVLLYHLGVEIDSRFVQYHYFNIFKVPTFGVDFFFVLSGFIIFYIHKKDIAHRKKVFSFLKKRFVRIVPVYWILLSITVLSFIITKTNIAKNPVYMTFSHIVPSYFFFPTLTPILTTSWTLTYEVYFYIIFSLLILFKQTKILLIILGSYAFFLLVKNFMVATPLFFASSLTNWGSVIQNYLILEFFLGVGAGYFFFKLPSFSSVIAKRIIILSIILILIDWVLEFFFPSWDRRYRLFTVALPAAALLFATAKFENKHQIKVNKFLNFLGDASYPLYLSQSFLLIVLFKFFALSHIQPNGITITLFAFGAIIYCIILAGLFHIFIEKKILQKLRQ